MILTVVEDVVSIDQQCFMRDLAFTEDYYYACLHPACTGVGAVVAQHEGVLLSLFQSECVSTFPASITLLLIVFPIPLFKE